MARIGAVPTEAVVNKGGKQAASYKKECRAPVSTLWGTRAMWWAVGTNQNDLSLIANQATQSAV